MLYVFLRIFVKPFLWLKYRPVVVNRQNLMVKDGAIFVCNHISMGDPLLLGLISLRYIHYMAKRELFKNPFLRVVFKGLLAFPVSRHKADVQSLKMAFELIKNGKVFGIFPEGKRSITGEIDEIERGTAFLAVRSGAPVIPVYISPETYRTGRLYARVGEPIYASEIPEDVPKSERLDLLTCRILNAMRALRVEQEASFSCK